MLVKFRSCKGCGKEFLPKHHRHIYCSRDCFKKIYNGDGKPMWICPQCKTKTKLKFNPIGSSVGSKKWRSTKCKKCGYSTKDNFKIEVDIEKTKKIFE